jgi:PAS domain-containing protein
MSLNDLLPFDHAALSLKAAEDQLAQTTEVLRVSEARHRTAFENSLDAICMTRMDDGTFIDVIGFSRQELVDQTVMVPNRWVGLDGEAHEDVFLDLTAQTSLGLSLWADPHDRERLLEILRTDSVCRNFETQWRNRSGVLRWVQISGLCCDKDV